MRKYILGYSFFELLITLTILGVLAAISYPSYFHHVLKSRRIEGKTALLDLSARMEHYFLINNTYKGSTLAHLGISSLTAHHYYELTIPEVNSNSYQITAKPIGSQEKDKDCGTFLYDSLGKEDITGQGNSSECWS